MKRLLAVCSLLVSTSTCFDDYHGFHHARQMDAVIENDSVIAHDDVIKMLPRLTRKSVAYIDSRAGKSEPFFLYVPLGSPHTPIVPTPEWQGKSGHFAYRQGRWKLILARGSGGWSSPKEKDVPPGTPIAQLYDLATDSSENTNLYLDKPEVAERLLRQLQDDVLSGRSIKGPASKNDLDEIVVWKSGRAPN